MTPPPNTHHPRLRATLLLLVIAAVSLRAVPAATFNDLTVASDAFVQGGVHIGTLNGDSTLPGYTITVDQQVTVQENVIWIEGQTYEEIVWHEDYDWIDTGYYEDIYEDQDVDVWVEEEGYYEQVYVGDDEDDNPIYEDGDWIVTQEGYWATETHSVWVDSVWVDGEPYWGVVNTYTTSEWITIEGYEETITTTSYETPVVTHAARQSDSVWVWQNPSSTVGVRQLMKLSTGGLSFPAAIPNGWTQRSLINDKGLTFSEVLNTNQNALRQAYGSKMTRNGLEVWGEENGPLQTTQSDRLQNPGAEAGIKVDHNAVHLSRSYLNQGSTVTKVTRVLADYAEFGGSVKVHGVLRIPPAGDLSMGPYTNGPQP